MVVNHGLEFSSSIILAFSYSYGLEIVFGLGREIGFMFGILDLDFGYQEMEIANWKLALDIRFENWKQKLDSWIE